MAEYDGTVYYDWETECVQENCEEVACFTK